MQIPRTTFRKRNSAVALLATSALLLVSACSGSGGGTGDNKGEAECADGPASAVTIAHQPGLGYAPLLMAKQQGSLEEATPDVDIDWRELNSGAAIRDGVLSGDIQVASGGIGPFIIGAAAGVDWKILSALNNMELKLMTMDPEVQSLADLQEGENIAMPGPDSIQSIVLRKGAQAELGDARALDSQIVAMGHPDGMQALLANQIGAHLTSPPFQNQEAEANATEILNSYDLFGEHTFNSAFTTEEFAACNPDLTDALVDAIAEANQTLNEDPAAAAEVLSAEMGISPDAIEQQLTDDGVTFTGTPQGIGDFASFMLEIGLIKDMPEDNTEYFFENEATQGGS